MQCGPMFIPARIRELFIPRKPEACALDPRCDFEASVGESALKFEIAYITLMVAGVFVYQSWGLMIDWWAQAVPLWPIVLTSCVMRCLALLCRWRKIFRPHVLAACCLVLDVTLVASIHPRAGMSGYWWCEAFDFDGCGERHAGISTHVPLDEKQAYVDSVVGEMRTAASAAAELAIASSSNSTEVSNAVTATTEVIWGSLEQALGETWEEQYIADWNGRLEQYELMMVVVLIQMLVWYCVTFVMLLRHAVCSTFSGFIIYTCLVAYTADDYLCCSLDISLMGFTMILTVSAKARWELTQRDLFSLMANKCSEALNEKVLRFKAEFAEDQLRTWADAAKRGATEEASTTIRYDATPQGLDLAQVPSRPRPPPSVRSAPPAMANFLQACLATSCHNPGDCLPLDALVWMEGRPQPVPAKDVKPGHRVLCYDSLGQCPKYAKVSGTRMLEGEAPWVKVVLADGSTLEMTANHPVRPQLADNSAGVPVFASKLQPGLHSLMVLKMQAVAVDSVTSCASPREQAGPETRAAAHTRLALTLAQPDRHQVFVAPAGCNGTVAVGSADTAVGLDDKFGLGLVVKRTFFEMDERTDAEVGMRRVNSEPARLDAAAGKLFPEDEELADAAAAACPATTAGADGGGALSGAGGAGGGGGTAVRRVQITAPAMAADLHAPPRSGRSQLGMLRAPARSESEVSSTKTKSTWSVGSQSVDIDIGKGIFQEGVSLQEFQAIKAVRRQGFRSQGSACHATGECQVCPFENRHQHTGSPPCWRGELCGRCHEDHPPLAKKKHRSGATRAGRHADPRFWTRSGPHRGLARLGVEASEDESEGCVRV